MLTPSSGNNTPRMKKAAILVLLLVQAAFSATAQDTPSYAADTLNRVLEPHMAITGEQYDSLLTRFIDNEVLTGDEYYAVYHGFSKHEGYTGSFIPGIIEIHEEQSNGNFENVYLIGTGSLKEYPVSPYMLYYTTDAAYRLGYDEEVYGPLRRKCFELWKAILASGDGLSKESAFRVLSVQDEYNFMSGALLIGAQNIKARETVYDEGLERYYDYFEIMPGETGLYHSTHIYFDITPSFEYMRKVTGD